MTVRSIYTMLSAMSAQTVDYASDVMFYVNFALVICTLIELTALIVLYKKTSCADVVGLATLMVLGLGLVLFIVQLVMYAYSMNGAVYAVYLSLAVLYCGGLLGGVYCGMLSKNTHKPLCIATAVCMLIPPVGAVLAIVLSYKVPRDTKIKALVFDGYAYTYAALGAFCDRNGAEFIDMSDDAEFEQLKPREAKNLLDSLKQNATDAEGQYKYASAIMAYTPKKYKKAIVLMRKSADAGNAEALFNLGCYYELGVYVKKDYKRADDYFTRAADVGDSEALMRKGILAIKSGNVQDGYNIFKSRAEHDDICAQFNLGVCAEKGIGVAPDTDKALDIYTECSAKGMFAAQTRIFAMAAKDITSAQNGAFFRHVTDREFGGTFDIMVKGLIEIKKRHAADAAVFFKDAVKQHDEWEGVARCLVGTLYIDCGEQPEDKVNGAEYIKSAFDLLPSARDVYAVIPKDIIKQSKAAAEQDK